MARPNRERLESIGNDPDYRFTLANERTFLAWVRTSMALLAAGVAVVSFVQGLPIARHILGFILIGLGGLVAALSSGHWHHNERAMRLGRSLPYSPIPRLVATALALTSIVALAIVIDDLIA